jgi:hypothetical protein
MFQKAWVRRQFPFPARLQTGPGHQPDIPAKARMVAVSKQPGRSWHGQEHDRQQSQRQMVRLDPD